jgi:hypothetical protein
VTRIFDSVVAKLLSCCAVTLATTLVASSAPAQVVYLSNSPSPASYSNDLYVLHQEPGNNGVISNTFYRPIPGGWESDSNNHGFTLIGCTTPSNGGSCACWNGHVVC